MQQQMGFPMQQQMGFPMQQQMGFPMQQMGFPMEQQQEGDFGEDSSYLFENATPDDLAEIRNLISFFGPNVSYNSIDQTMIQYKEEEIDNILDELMTNVSTVYDSTSDINGFRVLEASEDDIIYNDVVNLVVDNPLSFIVKHDRLISDEQAFAQKEDRDVIESLNFIKMYNDNKYIKTLAEFLAEFYEGDLNVYDETHELTFDSDDAYYLCKSHLCYLVKKMINDKLLSLYSIYFYETPHIIDESLSNLPIQLLENLNLNNNYILNIYDDFNPVERSKLEEEVKSIKENTAAAITELNKNRYNVEQITSLEQFEETFGLDIHVGNFIINPNKINIHDEKDFEKFVNTLNFETENNFVSFQKFTEKEIIQLFYDEIYDLNHHLNLNLAINLIKNLIKTIHPLDCSQDESYECLRNNFLKQKLIKNCLHAVNVFEAYSNYILQLRNAIQKYEIVNNEPNLFYNWTINLADSLASYEDDDYYYGGMFRTEIFEIVSSLTNINYETGLINILNSLPDIKWYDEIDKMKYGY